MTTTTGFQLDNIINMTALQNGLSKATKQYGLFLPMVGLDYAKMAALSAVNLGGPQQIIVQAAISSFFDTWKTNMVITG